MEKRWKVDEDQLQNKNNQTDPIYDPVFQDTVSQTKPNFDVGVSCSEFEHASGEVH